jgi:histone acetyltransferase (RNA polymerase elongator complex component)
VKLLNSNLLIREIVNDDCVTISNIIRDNLINVNIRDYPEKIINNMSRIFTPEYISDISKVRKVYVIVEDTKIIGTASLDQDTIYTVFIDINHHHKGFGRMLINFIERIALDSGTTSLKLPSSITAQGFYEKLGYHALEMIESEEFGRDIIMIKNIV